MPRAKKKDTKNKNNQDMSDSDELPLRQLKNNNSHFQDPNSYDYLCMPNIEQCEFCDSVAKNRYSSLIHNKTHIIIPLIKHTVHQCEMCLYYFTSTKDLSQHQYKKHSLIDLVSHTDIETFNDPGDKTYESDLITIVKNVSSNCKPIEISTCVKTEPIIDIETAKEGTSLKNRLMFEEDIVPDNCDEILNDLTVSCRVDVELFPPIWEDGYPQSVHYEQLMRPVVYRCGKCFDMFPNRYDMIIHETQHLFIKNSQVIFCNVCNKYILGNIKKLKHHKLSHNNFIESQNAYLDITKKQNGGDAVNDNGANVQKGVDDTRIMKICNICYSFCRNTALVNYYYVDELNEIGKRFSCEKCGYKFFHINLVKRISKRNGFKRKIKSNKGLSNVERLKHIASRFKMMKKIYFVVLFFPSLSS